jgi:flagellar biosynthesis protein FlhF
MRVKKFSAKNMKDALKMVKEELGPEAVILAAREIKKTSAMGGQLQSEVEVTAAISEFTLHKKNFTESRMSTETKQSFKNTNAKSQKHIIDKVVDRRLEQNERATQSQLSKVLGGNREVAAPGIRRKMTSTSYIDIHDDEDHIQVTQRPPQARPNLPPRHQHPRAQELLDEASHLSPRSLSRIRNAAKEAFTAGLSSLEGPSRKTNVIEQDDIQEDYRFEKLRPVSAAATAAPQNTKQIQNMQTEIDRLQTLLKQNAQPKSTVHSHPGAEYGIHYDMSFMFQKLLESGVNADGASFILLQAQKEMDAMQMKKRPLVDAFVARWFLTNTKVVPDSFQGRTHVFVGPAGSGKTSMLVKWASYLSLKKKKRIAILTTDIQKVGAVDQLKIYAQILNVPFLVMRNQNDWKELLTQFAHIDHFLVDTPGMQLRDLHEIDFLRAMLPPQELAAVTHLVLNCTAKDSDSLDNCKRFRLSNYQDLIFTNLDQSVQHGVIVNVQRELNIPLNSFGIGNSIPEDFEEATKERILDLIFKLTRIQRGATAHGI